jgi:hypothetical protein
MSSETRTLKINQQSELWDSPFTSQYTVTGHDMDAFISDWNQCVSRRKSNGLTIAESDVIAEMETLGYQFESNNFDVIEVEL